MSLAKLSCLFSQTKQADCLQIIHSDVVVSNELVANAATSSVGFSKNGSRGETERSKGQRGSRKPEI